MERTTFPTLEEWLDGLELGADHNLGALVVVGDVLVCQFASDQADPDHGRGYDWSIFDVSDPAEPRCIDEGGELNGFTRTRSGFLDCMCDVLGSFDGTPVVVAGDACSLDPDDGFWDDVDWFMGNRQADDPDRVRARVREALSAAVSESRGLGPWEPPRPEPASCVRLPVGGLPEVVEFDGSLCGIGEVVGIDDMSDCVEVYVACVWPSSEEGVEIDVYFDDRELDEEAAGFQGTRVAVGREVRTGRFVSVPDGDLHVVMDCLMGLPAPHGVWQPQQFV